MVNLSSLVVMYPDYNGNGTAKGFYDQVRKVPGLKEATIIPIINGDEETFEATTRRAKHEGLDVVISRESGLGPALLQGYKHCINSHPGKTIVRLDTAEHDPFQIPHLAKKAQELKGLAVGILSFDDGPYERGILDTVMDEYVFPAIYTLGAGIQLSCAHGYQAIDPNALEAVVKGAEAISMSITPGSTHPPSWGFDGAMAASAALQGYPLEVLKVPAQSDRKRRRAKIQRQLLQHSRLCLGARTAIRELSNK